MHPSLALGSCFGVLFLSIAGCSWTSDGGLGARIESPEATPESPKGSWNGEPIRGHDAHGTIEIVGVSGKRNVTVRATFVAGARAQTDADAAFDDLRAQLRVVKTDGVWVAACTNASAWHGSVDPESTGCTRYHVEVPADTLDAPLDATARADYGGVHASGITVRSLTASAPFGLVADVVPANDAVIELRGDDSLVSGFCSSLLRVPAGAAFESAELSVHNTQVRYVDVDPNDTRFWPGVEIEGLAIAPRTAAWKGSLAGSSTGAGASGKRVVLHAAVGKAKIGSEAVPAVATMNQCAT